MGRLVAATLFAFASASFAAHADDARTERPNAVSVTLAGLNFAGAGLDYDRWLTSWLGVDLPASSSARP